MSETLWLLLMAVISGGFGRALKIYPRMPKSVLPWLVLSAGYVLSMALAMYRGLPVDQAAQAAWTGLAAGLIAVGGHSSLRGLLVTLLGSHAADRLLGRLPGRPTEPPTVEAESLPPDSDEGETEAEAEVSEALDP